MRLGRERRYLVLLGLICLALIGGALYMQIVLGEAPCPLCILQRYALLLIAISAFAGAAMSSRRSISFFEVLVVIFALAGAATAGHHVYTQFYPAVSCGIDVLQRLESKARSFLGEPVMPLITIQAFIHRGNEFIQKVSPTAMAASRSAEAKKETKAPETMVEAVEAAQACTKCRVTRAGFKGCTKCMGLFFQVYKGHAKTKANATGKASDQLEETQT